ncbi:hypothetical protein [Halococcus saccharolyticus]|uniref:Glycosyltransferase RgtA/B/C/D-like domain-containing protein n=1 Tax=Halococcus saccharolyticus DSM 5350 TaxID=1227455 RepID=M0MMW4_9EURY|nr:hypothetical protein [Halococcus saccharolyticus]EMA45800.1 hypothetical protein C449_06041 [Halococcus saccharolyticus DSM 5350]
MVGSVDESESLFSLREILVIGWIGLTSVVAANVIIRWTNGGLIEKIQGATPTYWPISIFTFRLGRLRPAWAIGATVAAIVVFVVTGAYCCRRKNRLAPVIVTGLVLLGLSNLVHGFDHGFVAPLATREGYYQMAPGIADPLAFIRDYEANQLSYVVHARTHPPGSVLTFTLFDRVFGSRALISAAIALVSLPTSAVLLYRLVGTYYERDVAWYVTVLFVLLPAVQIYYLASLDAIIATLMLGAVYFFTRKSWFATLGTFACLLVVSFQMFLFVFLLPVLAAIALDRREKRVPFVAILIGLVGWYALVDVALGYDYLHSFLLASNQQNPEGFLLTAKPAWYVYSRLEDIAELALFFTPFLCLLAIRGARALRRDVLGSGGWLPANASEREPVLIAGVAIGSFAALLAAGVYHTGETARGAMYLYPFLLLPVAAAVKRTAPAERERWLLAAAVFGQSLLMQLVGGYLW